MIAAIPGSTAETRRGRGDYVRLMAKLSLTATLTCQDGKTDEFDVALATLIEASEEEPGLEIYSAHRVPDTNDYVFFELYTDEDALAVHGKGPEMRSAMGALGALLAGAPAITMLTPVVAKGMEL